MLVIVWLNLYRIYQTQCQTTEEKYSVKQSFQTSKNFEGSKDYEVEITIYQRFLKLQVNTTKLHLNQTHNRRYFTKE